MFFPAKSCYVIFVVYLIWSADAIPNDSSFNGALSPTDQDPTHDLTASDHVNAHSESNRSHFNRSQSHHFRMLLILFSCLIGWPQEAAYMSTTSSASTPAPRPPTSTTSESQSLFGEEVESIPVENPQQQGTKRRKTSDVWNHFKKRNIDGKVKAQCNYCGKLMAGASTSGMTHLKLHIAKSFPSAPKEASPSREGTDIRRQVLVKQHNKARSKGISSPSVFNEEDQKASRRDLA